MSFEIRKADRGDLKNILDLVFEESPVIDGALLNRFDGILAQTGFELLLAEKDGYPVGLLSVTVIDGPGSSSRLP